MDKLETIDVQPVKLDMCREHCEQIYNDYREASHFDTVALMMMAYRRGKSEGAIESLEFAQSAFRKVYTPPKEETEERGIMDLAREMKAACDHFDALDRDRRTLAREVNGTERTRWIR